MTRAVLVATGFVAVTGGWVAAEQAATSPPAAGLNVNPQSKALQEFETRLRDYLALRESLVRKLKPLSPTPSATELTERQQALAAAMRAARSNAKVGDLVPALIAKQISDIIAADFQRRNPAATKGTLKEVPTAANPKVNRVYPPGDAMPTVPPLLLKNLPQLPDNLQYRFFGRSIVALDGDLQLIVDVIPGVLPPH